MPVAEEEERAAFEEWIEAKHIGFCARLADGDYQFPSVQLAWAAWLARAARGKEAGVEIIRAALSQGESGQKGSE